MPEPEEGRPEVAFRPSPVETNAFDGVDDVMSTEPTKRGGTAGGGCCCCRNTG